MSRRLRGFNWNQNVFRCSGTDFAICCDTVWWWCGGGVEMMGSQDWCMLHIVQWNRTNKIRFAPFCKSDLLWPQNRSDKKNRFDEIFSATSSRVLYSLRWGEAMATVATSTATPLKRGDRYSAERRKRKKWSHNIIPNSIVCRCSGVTTRRTNGESYRK